ncbi:TonB-dependent siderophore receptor [Burkholderia contaminans]|uniref:TonB-dependent siderophore receptor n=1 Tax=Burkholderia contaminans TaxID=488447 RepID=UPI0014536208|nr:TonB-dependent receptor [Burkholderia contaminans]VWC63675.1 TonB-dependent siderophore receptor [Burkholderia contaminans]
MKKSKQPAVRALARHVAAIVVGMASIPLYAQTSINLPAQSLSATLSQLAREAGVNILAPDNIVAGRAAPAVSGMLTVNDALARLLNGTGLRVEQVDAKTYVIKRSDPPPSPGASKSGKDSVLPTITVSESTSSASLDKGFVADSTSTATRTDTPISQTAQSIQVVTKDLLNSKQTQTVSEALANVSGVTVQDWGNGAQVSVRGFTAATMSNGHNDTGSSNSLDIPVAGVERIEVLKGADSILSGAMVPGGVVNIVIKKPTAETVRQLTLQTGSYGDWMSSIDLGGALTSDKSLRYRFVLSAERAGESFGGYDGQRNFYVAPSIEWKAGNTDIVLGYQHQVVNRPPIQLTQPRVGDDPLPIHSRSTPSQNSLSQMDTLSVDFTQQLGSIFKFESKAQYQQSTFSLRDFYDPIGIGSGKTVFVGFNDRSRSYGFDLDNHLQAKFSLGPVKQTVLVGVSNSDYWTDFIGLPMKFLVAPFPLASAPPISGTPKYYGSPVKSYSSTVYFQDQITWDRLHILASIARGTVWGTNTASQSQWSPNLGILYQLTDNVAVYANALRSFYPQYGTLLLDGSVPPPQIGRSVEAGFKFNFFDDRLSATADVFRTAQSNVLVGIPGTNFATLGGGMVVRGVELSLTGRLFPGLNVFANYTFSNQQQITDGVSEVPRHSGTIWMTYDLQGERLHGWGVGAGVEARSGYQVSNSRLGVFKAPGQAQTDASVYYHAKQWTATLGVKNLFNRTLYQNQMTSSIVGLQPGRLIYLTGRYNF